MGLKIENIYKDIYLYISIVLILIFIQKYKIKAINDLLKKKLDKYLYNINFKLFTTF